MTNINKNFFTSGEDPLVNDTISYKDYVYLQKLNSEYFYKMLEGELSVKNAITMIKKRAKKHFD